VSDVLRRAEHHFDGARGRLFGRSWEGPAPRREVVLVHGYGEHSGRYEHVGRFLAERGARVHAYDHQGHGRSGGPRCHVRRFSDFLDDLERVVERARSASPGGPIYVIGHSMGGLITCAWARERRPEVAGLVVSAPALAAPGGPSPALLRLLPVVSRIAPRLSLASELDPQGLSRDPAVVAAYLADPLVHLRMTLSLARELFAAMGRTADGGADLALPALMLHGAEDPICSPEASRRFADAAPDCRYLGYPRLRHEIFNEPERETVLGDVQAWIEQREESAERSTARSTGRATQGP
jgi:alpha-beta hydrolase superfamily lysophospholipase